MPDSHVDLNNARPGVYTDVIKKIQEDKICPFCIEHLQSVHPNPIEEKTYWVVTDNAYAYKPKKQHVLLIHKEHIDDIAHISAEAWNELHDIIKSEKEKRGITGGTFIMRFGETKYTGASVTHLHAHLFQSDPDHEDYGPSGVLTRVG
jgi:diadenosine tetraphosphate (Ap4A) HIT family hydrolase